MADIHTSYGNGRNGMPAFESLDTYIQSNLLCSAVPPMEETVRVLMADSLTLAQYSVVGLDADGKLALAVTGSADPADDIAPIGVLGHAATSSASNTTIHGEVYMTGDYNIDDDSPLVWDASFDSAAKKTFAPVPNTGARLMFRSRTQSGVAKP